MGGVLLLPCMHWERESLDGMVGWDISMEHGASLTWRFSDSEFDAAFTNTLTPSFTFL